MHVAGDDAGLSLIQARQIRCSPAKGRESLVGFQVTNMLADKDFFSDAQGNTVFQMGADRQNGWQRVFHVNRQWRVASCAPQNHLAVTNHTCDRVIHMPDDGPVMNQKIIGYFFQPFQRLSLVNADRLATTGIPRSFIKI